MLKICAATVPIVIGAYCVDRYYPSHKYKIEKTERWWFSSYDTTHDKIKKDNVALHLKTPVVINNVSKNDITYYSIFRRYTRSYGPCDNEKEKCLSKHDIEVINSKIKKYIGEKQEFEQLEYISKYGKLLSATVCRKKDDPLNNKMYSIIQSKIKPILHDHMKLCSNMHFIDEKLVTIIDKMINPYIKINKNKSKFCKYPILEINEDISDGIGFTIHHITGYRNPEIHHEISFHVAIDKTELENLINYVPRNHLEVIIKEYALKYENWTDTALWTKHAPLDIINNYGATKDNIIQLDYVADHNSYRIDRYTSCPKDDDCVEP